MNDPVSRRIALVRRLAYVLFFFAGVFLLFSASVAPSVIREVPDIVELSLENTEGDYTFSVFELARARQFDMDRYAFSAACDRDVTVSLPGGIAQPAEAVYCDGDYALIYSLPLYSGTFFPATEGTGSPNFCVIDSDLAGILFAESDPLDQWICVGDDLYRVCGVTTVTHGLLTDAVRSGHAHIYLPYGSLKDWRSVSVSRVGVRLFDGVQASISTIASDILYKTGGYGVGIRDIHSELPFATQFPALCRGAVTLVGIFILLFSSVRVCKSLVASLSGSLKIRYFRDAVKSRRNGIISHLACVVLFFVGIVLLCIFGLSMPLLKDQWVSYDNIFDLSFYFSAWADAVHLRAADPGLYQSDAYRMLATSFRLQLLTLAFGFVFEILAVYLYKCCRKGPESFVPAGIALSLSVVCAGALCSAFGVGLSGALSLYVLLLIPLAALLLEDLVIGQKIEEDIL